MLEDKYLIVKLTIAALILALASPALAELKTSYTASGNNVGMVVQAGGAYGGPLVSSSHQFPRGSGNFYSTGRWNWGLHVARDADGDGTAEDTAAVLSRGGNVTGGNQSLESIDQITALAASGATMSEASSKREVNPLFVSTDADDLANWPPEFREGRSASGAPILYGAETIAARFGDCFVEAGIGQSVEYQFYFMNFGESNDYVYMHIFFRNMSEYNKWHSNPDVVAKVAGTPDGQVWHGMEQFYCTANGFRIGGRDEAWAYYFPKQLIMMADRDGVEGGFTGHPAAMVYYQKRNPHLRDEVLEFTNTAAHGWNTEWGFYPEEPMEGGYPMNKCYRYGLGKNANEVFYPDAVNPWTEGPMYGFPGVLEEGDARYEQWVWGERNANNSYNYWSEFHDVMPRDSFSLDAVIMFVHLANEPYAWKSSQDMANLDIPEVNVNLAPLVESSDVADVVAGGGFILPETPSPPPLTIIPGDRMVTITWSDVNVNTPDAFYGFLQENDMDPDKIYKEYDFEGYRLYRSFVGPNDSHSELIFECSLSEGDLTFFFIDSWDDDEPYYRLMNGMKVWYAMVPYDNNTDPSSGVSFSLPTLSSGKSWNRSGSGLYTVEPRSDASEFKHAQISSITFTPSHAQAGELRTQAVLAGEETDDGRVLTEAPLYLEPGVEILFSPIIEELITQDMTLSLVCTDWAPNGAQAGRRYMELRDGSGNVLEEFRLVVKGWGTNGGMTNVAHAHGMTVDGPVWAVEAEFDVNSASTLQTSMDIGSYSGAAVDYIAGGLWDWDWNNKEGLAYRGDETNKALVRCGEFVITWKDAGGGSLSVDVMDNTRGVSVPFSAYIDDEGWGFMPPGEARWTYAEEWGIEWGGPDNVEIPQSERTTLLVQTVAADNDVEFNLWVDGQVWAFSGISAMPAAGTTMIVRTAYGSWAGTTFTQQPDAPAPGEKWTIETTKSSMDKEDADLTKIRVVPNPYLASSFLDLSPDSRRIEFVNLPSRCTIRIYSLGGHLVNVLNHIGANRHGWGNYDDWDRLDSNSDPKVFTGHDNHSGTEPWNLRNRFGQTVASGLYFYHVTDQRGEEHIGRFYVVN
ncbi:hypothetical protein ACFL5K_00835 [Gemmatimonadota bacterium]